MVSLWSTRVLGAPSPWILQFHRLKLNFWNTLKQRFEGSWASVTTCNNMFPESKGFLTSWARSPAGHRTQGTEHHTSSTWLWALIRCLTAAGAANAIVKYWFLGDVLELLLHIQCLLAALKSVRLHWLCSRFFLLTCWCFARGACKWYVLVSLRAGQRLLSGVTLLDLCPSSNSDLLTNTAR